MKRLAALIFWFALVYSAHAQSVQQSGVVTPTHLACWTTGGVIQDCGTAVNPFATSAGAVGPVCSLSAGITGPYQQFCLQAGPTGGVISIQNFGGASAGGISFNVNGTPSNFATVPASTTNGDLACYIGTSGQLGDCGTISPSQLPASVLSNTRIAKTGAYAAVSGDCGGTLALGGGAFYTLTLNAASGYASNCVFYIVNEDNGRGKQIAINGYSSFILWPNQTLTVIGTNNVWRFTLPPRWLNAGLASVQVDPVNGSDSNNDCLGTTTGSCQSIPGAVSIATKFMDAQGGSIQILLANGTYSTGLPYTFSGGTSGYFLITLTGNTGQGANVNISGQFSIKDFIAVSFHEMTFAATSGSAIEADQNGIVDISSTVTFGTGGAGLLFTPMDAENGGVVNVSGGATINLSSMNIGMIARNTGRINMVASVAIPTAISVQTAFAFADTDGVIFRSGGTFTGAGVAGTTGTRYTAATAGGINSGGGGANFFPGNSAGTATSPGWYQ